MMSTFNALLLLLLSSTPAFGLTNYSMWYDLDTNLLSYTSGQWRVVPFNVPHSAHPYGEAILEVVTTTQPPLGLKVPRVRTTDGQNHPLVYWSNSTAECVNYLPCTQVWQILIIPHQCDFSGSYEFEWTTTCSSTSEIYLGAEATCIFEDHGDATVGPYEIAIESTHLAQCLTSDDIALSPAGPGLRAFTDQYLETPTTEFPYGSMAYFQVSLESPGVASSVDIDHVWLDVNMPHVSEGHELPDDTHGDIFMDALFQITRWRVMLCENQIRADETVQSGGEWLPIGCFHELSKFYHANNALEMRENIRSTDLSPAFEFRLDSSILPRGDHQAELVVNINLAITLKSGRRRLARVSSSLAPNRRRLPEPSVQERRRQETASGFTFEESDDFASGQYMIFNDATDTAQEMVVVVGYYESELETERGTHTLKLGEDEVEIGVYADTLAAALEDKWPLEKGRITVSALWACQEVEVCDLLYGASPNDLWRPALSEEPVATIELTLIFHFVISVGSPRAETVGVELQQMFLNADGDLYLLQPLHRAVPLRSYLADGTNAGPWKAPDPAAQRVEEKILLIATTVSTAVFFLCFLVVPRMLAKCIKPKGSGGMRTAGSVQSQGAEDASGSSNGPTGVGWAMTAVVGAFSQVMIGLAFLSSYNRAVAEHEEWEVSTLHFNYLEMLACSVGSLLFWLAIFISTCGVFGCPNTGGWCMTVWLILINAVATAIILYQDESGWFFAVFLALTITLTLLGICFLATGAGREPIRQAMQSMGRMTLGRSSSRFSKQAGEPSQGPMDLDRPPSWKDLRKFSSNRQSEAGSKRSSRSKQATSIGPRGEASEANIFTAGRRSKSSSNKDNRKFMDDAWTSPRKGEPSAPPSTITRSDSRAEGEERRSGFGWFKSKKSNNSLFVGTARRINTNFAEAKSGSRRDPKLASIGDMSVQSSGTRRIVREEAPLDPSASANYQRTTRGFDADSDKSSTDRGNLRGSGLSTWERRLKARKEIYSAKKKRTRERERRKSAKKTATSGREEKPDRRSSSNRQKHGSSRRHAESRSVQKQRSRKESSGEVSSDEHPRGGAMRGTYVD